jgi:hypothetical protein
MKDIVAEWVEKAEGDFHSAERELRAAVKAMRMVRAFVCKKLRLP